VGGNIWFCALGMGLRKWFGKKLNKEYPNIILYYEVMGNDQSHEP